MFIFVIMNFELLKYKGIHPGAILERELAKRSLKQRPFAMQINEYPQTLNAIIKGKRSMPVSLALKIDRELNLEEGTFALLQTLYDVKVEKQKQGLLKPNLKILRESLFWDTDIEKIDWQQQYKSVIQRIYERGNKEEWEEIRRFYGKEKIQSALNANKTKPI